MKTYDFFGINRSIEPRGSLPQPAWKLDNTMQAEANEILVEVHTISINLVSFHQILESSHYQDDQIRHRIFQIIAERGKLHNPITGTGGMLFGKVTFIGDSYPNRYGICVGDEIISLISLSATPLSIKKILSIDYAHAQLEVSGECILFQNAPLIKRPEQIPLKLAIASMDEAGAPMRTYQTLQKGQSVLILGASGRIGLFCAYAAIDRLQGTGRLVGLVKTEEEKLSLQQSGLFQEVLTMDASDLSAFRRKMPLDILDGFDVVINCINSPNTEMLSLLAAKNQGVLYFATLSCDYKITALTAESIGKEVRIIPYTGYMEGHAAYTLDLLQRFQPLRHLLQKHSDASSILPKEKSYSLPCASLFNPEYLNGFIFRSKAAKKMLHQALKVAPFNSNVMIYGESGVGKEIIAQMIHQQSQRKSFPMIKINCAAIPENLLESELFGYEKGSFTGASQAGKIGLWEAAQNGTLFLDEVGELPLSFQAKLLRAIQEREIIRVGGISPIKVDVRILAATNHSLETMVQNNLFREDLYYRLNVFPLTVPPLRQRIDDIIPLADFFMQQYNREFKMKKIFAPSTLQILEKLPYKGNIRELQNLVQRMMILADTTVLEPKNIFEAITHDQNPEELASFQESLSFFHVFPSTPKESKTSKPDVFACSSCIENPISLKSFLEEKEKKILQEYKRIYKSTRSIAKALQISQPTVVRKLKYYDIP